jgi:hypothetical protein
MVQQILFQLKAQERITGVAGMKKSSIVQWYVEALYETEQIDSEESLVQNRKIIKSVIQRLIKQEHALLEMRDTTILGDDEDESGAEDPVLVINPGYYSESLL